MSQNVNVNLTPGGYPKEFHVSQYDVGRQLVAKVVDSTGDYSIPSGATVVLVGTKPSGFGFTLNGTISGSTVTFSTTATVTAEYGRIPCELRITSGDTVLGTANLMLIVEESPHQEGVIDGNSETVIPELTILVERVEAAASNVLDMQVEADTLPAGSSATYLYDEETNTATFGIPQGEAGAGAAGVVAPAYSASSTYAVGDYVIHDGNLYRCTTAITTAEAFTAAHWTQVVLGDDVSDLKSDLSTQYVNLFDKYAVTKDKYVDASGNIVDGAIYDLTDFMPVTNYCRIKFTAADATVNTVVVRYDSNKNFIDRVVASGSEFLIANTGYVRINMLKSNVKQETLIVTNGLGKYEYSPYKIANDIYARDKIESLKHSVFCDDLYDFKIGNYTFTIGNVPTYNSGTVSRFCIDGFILIRKGETISTKWSNVSFLLSFCDKNGVVISGNDTYVNTYTATDDVYAYVVFKSESISDYTIGNWMSAHSYFFHKFKLSESIWKEKTWYSFGTSMSDINPDGVTGNNGTLGKYPLIIDELSGMIRTNKAIGGGGIVPSADHGGNVKANIMQCPYDVDLVTLELGLNDWSAITLGNIGDKSDNTFIGNFTQCVEYLSYHTRAKLVYISMIPLTYSNYATGERRDVFFKNRYGYTYRDYINAMIEVCKYYGVEVIDAQANALSNGRLNKDTIIDSTHFKDLGGEIYGRYIWSKLKDILTLPKFPNNL